MSEEHSKRKAGGGQVEDQPVKRPRHEVIIIDDEEEDDVAIKREYHPTTRRSRKKDHTHQFQDLELITEMHRNLSSDMAEYSLRTRKLEFRYKALDRGLCLEKEASAALPVQLQSLECTLTQQDQIINTLQQRVQDLEERNSTAAQHGSTVDPAIKCSESHEGSEETMTMSVPETVKKAPATLRLSQQDFTPCPMLTNQGLGKLILNMNVFRHGSPPNPVRSLQLTMRMDQDIKAYSRDIPLFCDTLNFALFDVDYVIRGGRTAAYIGDHPDYTANTGKSNDDGMNVEDLHGLRILEMSYEEVAELGGRDEESVKAEQLESRGSALKAWQETNSPPRFVYDLGQLFLHRRGSHVKDHRIDLWSTRYNVVIDLASSRKPVWLVLRPEFEPLPSHSKYRTATHQKSELPFPSRPDWKLGGAAMAQLAKGFADLKYDRDSFVRSSGASFFIASELVHGTQSGETIRLKFKTPDLGQMTEAVAQGRQ
ncbi:hypothetical protein F5Y18DRAFT_427345 [Xylariaceae sp. FL1019]|nr:hypothetical protein F5Y18DRAFT_427345 [Xylariaceae sp. FL1019]